MSFWHNTFTCSYPEISNVVTRGTISTINSILIMNSWMDCWPAWIHWLLASLWIASASSWLTGIYESLWATSQNCFYLDYLPDVSLGFCHRDAGSVLSLFREHAEIAASLSWKQDLMVGNQTIGMPLSRWLQWLLCHQVGDCRWIVVLTDTISSVTASTAYEFSPHALSMEASPSLSI